ncbi:hypothetical protein CgunFtcFv8_006104 [Champsocephalus gunnari]|uniref:Uncharacterized protein n=1 Tax=Champsocephalus gunnari TaxID=52237 RepID=A0AAN8BWL7_CHAGU|nr:hypothetical protein CgunFtcFv8_006104 [Champsocephalus gunnari]
MFFIKQQQSASCTQLLITHQTRKASSLSCRQEAAFQAKIQPFCTAIGAAAVMGSGTSCHIEIENECTTYILVNPRMYINSGYCDTPLPPTVAPGATGTALFKKHNGTATGCVGVVTYDLRNKDTNLTAEKIAVMFSVPYDLHLYSNLGGRPLSHWPFPGRPCQVPPFPLALSALALPRPSVSDPPFCHWPFPGRPCQVPPFCH